MTLGDILIAEADIAQVIPEIVEDILQDFAGADPLLVGVMDGAVCFLADLMRAFPESVEVTTAHVRSYRGTKSGEVTIDRMPSEERIADRHVLLVEDIVDTGATAEKLIERMADMGAASVGVCALLDKPSRRTNNVEVEYAGFDVPDVFVVGYGLDYNGAYRNLRDVRELVVR